jgi:hypothetical protein
VPATIVVDGIVLETVQSIFDLGDLTLDLNAQGIVIDTVNWIGRIEQFAEINDGNLSLGVPIDGTDVISRLADNAMADFPWTDDTWQVETLTGFSLRIAVDGSDASDGSSAANQIVVETLKRDNLVLVQISNTSELEQGHHLVGYNVFQSDGRPLPAWVASANAGLLLVDAPVDFTTLDLRIVARLSDGTTFTRAVSIRLSSGEIQQLSVASARPPLFEEQLKVRNAN